jgi:hypothetical protein
MLRVFVSCRLVRWNKGATKTQRLEENRIERCRCSDKLVRFFCML